MLENVALAGVAAIGLTRPAAAITVDILVSGIVDRIITAWGIDVAFDPVLLGFGLAQPEGIANLPEGSSAPGTASAGRP